MQNNKVLYSDASYQVASKVASVSVYDLQEDEYVNQTYTGVENITSAETMALRLSISVAMSRGYDNVIFIYDNLNINVELLKNEYSKFFKIIQFVWMKRDFLEMVDKEAKKCLKRCFNLVPTVKPINKIDAFIEKISKNILNKYEIEIVKNWKEGIKDESKISNKTINFSNYRLIYSFIESKKIKEEFYKTILFYYPKVVNFTQFKENYTQEFIEERLLKA